MHHSPAPTRSWAIVLSVLAFLPLPSHAVAADGPASGQLVFSNDFEAGTPPAIGKLEPRDGGRCLLIENTDPAGAAMHSMPLPLERFRGCTILCSALVKA